MRKNLIKAILMSALALTLFLAPAALADDYEGNRFAFGIGAGLIQPDNSGLGDVDGELYYSANLRWRVRGGSHQDDDDDDWNGDRPRRRHYRGKAPQGGGIRGYLEAEIGLWEVSENGIDFEDQHIGLNLVGVVPTRAADFFMGVGFGLHFTDGSLLNDPSAEDFDDTRLGGNLQVGVDINVSQTVSVFGVGRLDILQDNPFDRQTKVWGGLRFQF